MVTHTPHVPRTTASHHSRSSEARKVGPDYDWTFTTEYKGTISAPVAEGADAAAAVAGSLVETEEKIDLDRLRVPEPMLFFDEVVLFEDELADNGDSFLSAKVVRVQPTVATATGLRVSALPLPRDS